MADVLFICTGNFYRSRFAEAVFNHHAELATIPERAVSRGLMAHMVDGELSPFTVRALAERSIALHHTSLMPTPLTVIDLTRATHLIALHEEEHRPMIAQRYPEWVDRITYWDVSDLPLPPEVALPEIERRVLALLAGMRP